MDNVKEGGEWVKILQERFGEDKAGAKTFPEQLHGWVVRADVTKDEGHKGVEEAIRLAHEYWSKF